jgi:hypothetical protein
MGSMVQIKGKIYFYTIDEFDTARSSFISTKKADFYGIEGVHAYSP